VAGDGWGFGTLDETFSAKNLNDGTFCDGTVRWNNILWLRLFCGWFILWSGTLSMRCLLIGLVA
jgi:hypothetical protein